MAPPGTKAIYVRESVHRQIKSLASLRGQRVSHYVEDVLLAHLANHPGIATERRVAAGLERSYVSEKRP